MKTIRKMKQFNKGESLAEVLIAILIIAVGLVLLSSLVLASTHMVERGNAKMTAIYEGENAMESKDLKTSSSKGTATITWGTESTSIAVDVYQDAKTDGKPNASGLISYKKAKQ